MIHSKLTIIGFIVFCTVLLRGQNLDKANIFYKDGYYAKAIPIYEAILKKKSSISIKSKLANSYRILNRAEKASATYKEIIQDNKAEPIDYFRYGEVMMMLSHYDSAQIYFKHFNDISPEDERGAMMLKALVRMKDITPAMKNVIIEPFKHNTDADESVPVFYKKSLVFASDRSSGFNLLKEKNQTTGRDYITLYLSEKLGDTAFATPKELSSKFSELNKNTGNISFTANEKFAYLCRNSSTSSKNGTYNMQLYSAESNGKNGWKKIKLIPFCNNEYNYMYPSVSPDGQRLFFVTERADGFGGLDIYFSKKTKKGWSKPENLGSKVNTSAHEGFPYLSEQGKLYFCSKGHAGYGGYDIFVTTQDSLTGEWGTPQNLGTPINSAYDDISFSFADSTWGGFTSARSGRGDDVFLFKIVNKIQEKSNLEIMTQSKNKGGFTFDIEVEKDEEIVLEDDMINLVDTIQTTTISYLDILSEKIQKGELHENDVFIMENVHFDTINLTVLTADMKTELDKLIPFMLANKKICIEIGAHTSFFDKNTEGVREPSNLKKNSEKQAEAIVQYMMDKGIKSKRLMSKGYGNTRPLKDCSEGGCPPEELLQNCRIELKIMKL